MKSVPWTLAATVISVMALSSIAGIVVTLSRGVSIQTVWALPFSLAWLVGLGFASRTAWRKALGRDKELPAGTSQGWEAGDR
ncbi:hypothetical protein ACFYXS_01265 [Streptomyces sp. NPDC002574]|uniref:hypothetical protein n=1 Tax=Streptomyces sp. NPDC002574 TaxID=3364652 RepID=UPI00368A42C5